MTSSQPSTQPSQPSAGKNAAAGGHDQQAHRYDATLAGQIEQRCQQFWETNKTFHIPNPGEPGWNDIKDRPKFYCLDMFPYPSGAGLHVGHPEGYTATDILCRYKRMNGYRVLHPMGWDAFGLPAEQHAINTGEHPASFTRKTIDNFRRQLQRFGFCYDWDREFATIDEDYYRWTQWIFLKIYDTWHDDNTGKGRPISELVEEFESGVRPARYNPRAAEIDQHERERDLGQWSNLDARTKRSIIDSYRLAYLGEQTVNWCPKLGTALANEEVIDGRSERGGYPVFRKPLRQWMFRITAYADRLLNGLSGVDWPESTRAMQAEWIGRSEGAEIDFPVDQAGNSALPGFLRVYTTRPDTIFGATYMVVAPEHALVDAVLANPAPETDAQSLAAYAQAARDRADVDRQESKEKTGVFTGVYCINPATGQRIPVWTADYVLAGYGHGAIMAVPAHDERDFEFARSFKLPITDVVYNRTFAGINHYVRHAIHTEIADESTSPGAWRRVLADMLGLITTANAEPDFFPAVLDAVRTRREGDDEDEEGVSKLAAAGVDIPSARGTLRAEWIESIKAMGVENFADLAKPFIDARFHDREGRAMPNPGYAVNSTGPDLSIDGQPTDRAKQTVIEWLESTGKGKRKVNYRLRDWLFSRQRYWGEPFPIVFDDNGDHHPVSPDKLPVSLPPMSDYQPVESDDPAPLLAKATDWVNTTAAEAGVAALPPGAKVTRETNTMPGWAGSCWYYLRYADPKNQNRFISKEAEQAWLGDVGVDLYIGGAEHAVLHLLYARFWHMVLHDLGEVSSPEPFRKLFHQGMITSFAYQRDDKSLVPIDQVKESPDGTPIEIATGKPLKPVVAKMSKSLKNVINPDDVIKDYGADTFRLYEMYMGPLEASKPWNTRDIVGLFRLLQKAWRLGIDESTGTIRHRADDARSTELERLIHRTTAKVGDDIERLSFHTAIASIYELVNAATSLSSSAADAGTSATVGSDNAAAPFTKDQLERFTLILAPFAPHIADELWRKLGHTDTSTIDATWPTFDPAMLVDDAVEIPVQVLGKLRGKIVVAPDATEDQIKEAALAEPRVAEHLAGKTVRKWVIVPGRLVNIVAN